MVSLQRKLYAEANKIASQNIFYYQFLEAHNLPEGLRPAYTWHQDCIFQCYYYSTYRHIIMTKSSINKLNQCIME